MSNKPKGAMGSPYVSNDKNGPSVAEMMGEAFDRLHEDSWDGGKKAKAKREKKQTDKINAELQKKIEQKKENIEISSDPTGVVENDAIAYDNTTTNTVKQFQPGAKKEMMKLLLDSDIEIDEVSEENIKFSYNKNQFVLLPL